MNKFYSLNNDVYLVEGNFNSAIYDLKEGKLYHIDSNLKNFIGKITTRNCKEITNLEQETLKKLLDSGVLVETERPKEKIDITSLKKNIRPSFAWLEITKKCNLRCSFCYEESSCELEEMMSMEDFRIAKDFLINYGVKRIQFIGGEPMLHPQLKDMIKECVGKFEFIEVYTNGNYISQQWCDFFKENKINVAMSMHSHIAEEHDRVTQVKGSHKLVRNALDLVIKNNIPYRVAAIGNKDVKIGEKPKDAEYKLRVGSPRMVGRCDISQMSLDMFKERVITLKTFSQKIDKDFVIKAVSGHQCFSKNFYIAYDLTVYPCVMERRISHGKLNRDGSFIDKDIFEKYSKDNIESCKGCEFRYSCYDCRPDAMNRPKKAKPWYCSYDPQTGEWADVEKMFDELKESNIV